MADILLCFPGGWPILRQTEDGAGRWKEHRFFSLNDINAPEKRHFDFLVVYDHLESDLQVNVPSSDSFLITGEPPAIFNYPRGFTAQFDEVITCQENLRHKNKSIRQQGLPWHVGRNQKNHVNLSWSKDYPELNGMKPVQKTRALSLICSNKTGTPAHKKRLEFVEGLKKIMGVEMQVFGRGFNEIEDKWDAIAPFKYHIVLENSSVDHYFTEKLTDSYLAWAFPFYFGAPNINRYFSSNSLEEIDVDDPEKSAGVIREFIEKNESTDFTEMLSEERNKVLNEFNLFQVITDLVDGKKPGLEGNGKNFYRALSFYPADRTLVRKIKDKIKTIIY